MLVQRAGEGDAKAFDELMRRHYRAAYAVALGVLGSRADAEDVCQESWLRALERLESCRNPERFVFWLLQIVRNRSRNHLEYRRIRQAEPLESSDASTVADPGRNLRREELRLRLERGLASLPDVEREIVLLHDMEGWSHRDIAESLGISEVMSRQHLFQARRQLRPLLGGPMIDGGYHDE